MKGASHVALGACAALGLHLGQPYLPGDLPALGLALAANVLGSLLPDMDSGEATIRRRTGTARSGGLLGWLVSLGMRLLGGHRTLTHSFLIAVPLAAAAYALRWPWLMALAAGYITHIAADMLTRRGVPLFWPLARRRIRWLPKWLTFRTGAWPEMLFVLAVVSATAYAYLVSADIDIQLLSLAPGRVIEVSFCKVAAANAPDNLVTALILANCSV